MASNVRFIDSLKVGAYSNEGSNITILDNVNNYLLTATGGNELQGEQQLQFDGVNLGIGGASSGARFEINDITGNDLLLIKNSSDQGIKVNNSGVFQLLEFNTLPTAVEGGIAYSSSGFFVGVE
jgi:hypothetical protein